MHKMEEVNYVQQRNNVVAIMESIGKFNCLGYLGEKALLKSLQRAKMYICGY